MVDLTFTRQIEILSAEDAPRRRHWSDADKIRVVEESHRGHRLVLATARRHGICRSMLTFWRRQYRDGELANASGPSFVPVKMNDIDSQAWLADVLVRLPDIIASQVPDLIPPSSSEKRLSD